MRNKAVFLLLIAALVFGCARFCGRDTGAPTPPGTLRPEEKVRVEVKRHSVKVIDKDRTVTKYVPKDATVTVRKDGTVRVDVKKAGVSNDYGISLMVNESRAKLALDARRLYFYQLGLHQGVSIDPTAAKLKNMFRPLVFGSYTFRNERFSNTSLWGGTELFPVSASFGVRLAF